MPGRSGNRSTADRPGARGAKPGSTEQDRAVLAAALDPIITINMRGDIQSASDSVQRVLGWTPSELLGRNVNILMPEPHHSGHDGYLARYHQTGKTNILNRPRRFEARRKDGSLVPIELCVSRAETPGAPLFVGIIRDMSVYVAAEQSHEAERARAQELLAEQTSALQTAHLRLRMADRMASIGTLAAGLGHDMNNVLLPVRARLNALRAASDSGRLPAAESKHIEEIRKSVAYLQQLADGLHFLALDPESEESRGGSGEATDLVEWWGQVGPLISKAVPKHVRVTASLPSGLPKVAVAPHRLTQAVLNLVVNAGEAVPPPSQRKRRQGYARLWARTCRIRGAAGVRVGVSDNGSGMSEDVKRRAFEMFFTTKPRGLGTGLGLALVRRVVEHAGGEVEVESAVGKGTVITLSIPAVVQPTKGPEGPSVAVSIGDGRAAALVSHILAMAGARAREGKAGAEDFWIADPQVVQLDEVQRWKALDRARSVVCFGGDGLSQAWRSEASLIIERTDDYEEMRAVIGRMLRTRG